ncbi:MAG: hypothetical protein WC862_03370 [Patescibacteria group bacterium]
MDQRKQTLLKLIIENHIQTALPVGSEFLIETSELEVSAATVRNEMRDLEEAGFLTHPHTSAGRVPTEAGYRYYVANLMKVEEPAEVLTKKIVLVIRHAKDFTEKAKAIARLFAGESGNAVIVAFNEKTVYYTGISNLFSQPEFRDYARTVRISAIFDQCEERMDDLYAAIDSDNPRVLVGRDNPLGDACSLIGTRLNKNDLFAMLGPMRMDYGRGSGLLNYLQTVV